MTNKVKIESKDFQSKKKMDIREYLQKVRLVGGKKPKSYSPTGYVI